MVYACVAHCLLASSVACVFYCLFVIHCNITSRLLARYMYMFISVSGISLSNYCIYLFTCRL